MADALRQTLPELEVLSNDESAKAYAVHLFERLRVVRTGLADSRWFDHPPLFPIPCSLSPVPSYTTVNMGIRFSCPACGRSLNVKAELAGKRGRCPHCQGKIVIPSGDGQGESVTADTVSESAGAARRALASSDTAAYIRPEDMPTVVNRAPAGLVARVIPAKVPETPSSSAAEASQPSPEADQLAVSKTAQGQTAAQSSAAATDPAATNAVAPDAMAVAPDAIGEAPQLQWYVMPPGAANQYGPAVGEEFRTWIAEGRVTGDSLVWRQDWPEWKRADAVFVQLQGPPTAPPGIAVMPGIPVAGGLPGGATLPTAGVPVGQFAHPIAGPPGVAVATADFPVIANANAFAVAGDSPSAAGRRPARPYQPRSNTGPMIVIIALLLAMIPLSYFVFKVISEQLAPGAAAKTAVKADKPQTITEEPQAETEAEPASSPNEAEE